MTIVQSFRVMSLVLLASITALAADDGVELLDGTFVDGRIVLEDHHGRVILKSPRTGMGQSYLRAHVRAMTTDGKGTELNARRAWAEEEKKALPLLEWTDAAKGQDPLPAYATQEWPKARLLVWANPGQDGAFDNKANWLEDGRPASAAPDKDTDVLLPAATQIYTVQGSRSGPSTCRHLTIERNAYSMTYLTVAGNLHIQKGGGMYHLMITGPKHTFLRNDNPYPKPGDARKYGKYTQNRAEAGSLSQMNHRINITKYANGSVEVLGTPGVGDEVYLSKGKMIIGPESEFRFNGSHAKGGFQVFHDATLEIQSGATIASFSHTNSNFDYMFGVYKGGKIQAGSPDRPLTKNAYLLMGLGGKSGSRQSGLLISEGADLRVYSRDPENAKLVISSITGRTDFYDGFGEKVGDPAKMAHGKESGIEVHLGGNVDFGGIAVDYVRLGGIGVVKPESRDDWRQLAVGENNAGPLNQLVAPITVAFDEYGGRRWYTAQGQLQGLQKLGEEVYIPKWMGASRRRVVISPFHTGPLDEVDGAFRSTIGETVEVKLSAAANEGEIRYTLDGSRPAAQSVVYTKPLVLDQDTTIKARCFVDDIGGGTSTVQFAFEKPLASVASAESLKPGLRYRSHEWSDGMLGYHKKGLSTGPVLSDESFVTEGIADTLQVVNAEKGTTQIGLLFTGHIRVPKTGTYTFSANANDCCVVYIGGEEVVRAWDVSGGRGGIGTDFREDGGANRRRGRIALAEGLHTIRVEYAEWENGRDKAGPDLDLRVYIEGLGIEKQEIPASMLFHDDRLVASR